MIFCSADRLRRFMGDRRAITSLEYGLIGLLIVVVIVGAVTVFAGDVSTTFSKVSSSVHTATK